MTVWIQGLVSGFVTHYWEIWKVVNGHKPIRQMAGLILRHWAILALAEVALSQCF